MAIWSQLAIVLLGLHGATWLLEAICFAGSMVCFVVLGFEEKCWSTQAHRHTHTNKQTQQSMTLGFHTRHSKQTSQSSWIARVEPWLSLEL